MSGVFLCCKGKNFIDVDQGRRRVQLLPIPILLVRMVVRLGSLSIRLDRRSILFWSPPITNQQDKP